MKSIKDSAVSPVVGVLLMLVVTIIIAAIVSSFAGGLASDQSKAPQASLSMSYHIDGFNSSEKSNLTNYLEFKHNGGDAFSINDIEVELQSQDTKITISNADTINTSTSILPSTIKKYLEEISPADGGDKMIQPGDIFRLYADGATPMKDYGSYGVYPASISWKPVEAVSGMSLSQNTQCEYKIVDKNSGKTIQQGTFVIT